MKASARAREAEGGVARAEEAGLVFAFRARTAATVIVATSLLVLAPWPRSLFYVGFAVLFLLSGYMPFRLRHHRGAGSLRLACVAVDVVLITAAVLNLPGGGIWIDWPIQTRLRSQNFLLLLMLLGEAALTYSPRRVLWTGAWIVLVWSAAFFALYRLPNSMRYGDIVAQRSDEGLLALILSPTYVSLPQWLLQIAATVVLTALIATAVHRGRAHLVAQVRAEVLRQGLARYVSPDVALALSASAAPTFGQPATRHVAVLFADIVGFTAFSEHLPPERTFALLRSFQERSARVVFEHRGTLDKFLGDGLMATFGALRDEPDAAARAIECAFRLQEEVERWNAKRSDRGAERLSISIGLHYGPVVVGNIGGEQRVEFTAIGDVVNVASRLEHMTRELGCRIIVSEACVSAAPGIQRLPQLVRREPISLRGRTGPLTIHIAG